MRGPQFVYGYVGAGLDTSSPASVCRGTTLQKPYSHLNVGLYHAIPTVVLSIQDDLHQPYTFLMANTLFRTFLPASMNAANFSSFLGLLLPTRIFTRLVRAQSKACSSCPLTVLAS